MPSKTSVASPKSSILRNALLNLICLGVTLGIVFTIYGIRHRHYLKSLSGYAQMTSSSYQPPVFPKLSPQEVANLGWAHDEEDHPQSSYIHFAEKKPEGTIRIGAFGDSFTAGSEAATYHDYPSFLQQEFRKAGLNHFEVINFGVGSFGMHQAFLMWKYLGKKYDLDYVIFMIFEYHIERDSTFIKSPDTYGGVHARYILNNDRLELVPVTGQDRLEASNRYFSVFQPLRYVRYDDKAPTFIRALLPPGRELTSNPFYYRRGLSLEEEMLTSYALILNELSKEVKNVILVSHHERILALRERVSLPNVYFMQTQVLKDSLPKLYHAPKSHFSALGYQLKAKEFFSLLTGQDRLAWKILQVTDAPPDEPLIFEPNAFPLHHYDAVFAAIENYPAASFVIRKADKSERKFGVERRYERKLNTGPVLKKNKVAALLHTSADELVYIPISFMLKNKESVFISFTLDDERIKIPFGAIETRDGVMGKISLPHEKSKKDFVSKGEGWSLTVREGDFLNQFSITAGENVKELSILIGDQKILEGEKARPKKGKMRKGLQFHFKPVFSDFFKLRVKAGQFIDLDSLEKGNGDMTLQLERKGAEKETLPFFLRYEVIPTNFQPFERKYPNTIFRKNDQPVPA